MKKPIKIISCCLLLASAGTSLVMATPPDALDQMEMGNLHNSFMAAKSVDEFTFKEFSNKMAKSVSLEDAIYNEDSDDEEEVVQKRLSRQNSQKNLTKEINAPKSSFLSTVISHVKSFFYRFFG